MEFEEYEKLVENQTKLLQTKVTAAIDKGINAMEKIKSDPRKSAIERLMVMLEPKTPG